jgi:hypothetical protein
MPSCRTRRRHRQQHEKGSDQDLRHDYLWASLCRRARAARMRAARLREAAVLARRCVDLRTAFVFARAFLLRATECRR